MIRRLPSPPVLIVTDRHQVDGGAAALGAVVSAALACGARWISMREKDMLIDEQIALARDLKQRAEAFGAILTLHGTAETALRAGVDGVHLSEQEDVVAARSLLGAHAFIGKSAHSFEQVIEADPSLVDYVVVGPAFPTLSKPGYGPALQAGGLSTLVKAARVPVIAIGGIDAETVQDVLQTGVAGVAVMGAAMRSNLRESAFSKILHCYA